MTQVVPGEWNREINVRDFIIRNYTPYDGDAGFLAPPTDRTRALWERLSELMKVERSRQGVYDIDESTISTITSHAPGYIDRELEQIVGLQTDAPLKRAIMPFGGIRLIHTELEAYGREMDPVVEHVFKYRKTHNARPRLRCRHGKHMRALFRSDSAGRGGFGLAYPCA